MQKGRKSVDNNNKSYDSTRPFVVVGLGNPGKEYENTRHNVGFKVIDRLAASLGVSLEKNKKLHAQMANAVVEGKQVYLVEPQTFMNQSGR